MKAWWDRRLEDVGPSHRGLHHQREDIQGYLDSQDIQLDRKLEGVGPFHRGLHHQREDIQGYLDSMDIQLDI